jgi:lysophospholipase L1-like esterase
MKYTNYLAGLMLLFIGTPLCSSSAHTNDPEPLLTIYAVDPTNPQISFDQDPYVYSPPVPENPMVMYPTTGDAPTPSTPPGPGVITSDAPPDSYTLNRSDWTKYVYYALPAENATVTNGPYRTSGAPMQFDFGTATSPVQTGYTRVSPSTLYSPGTGYGWGATGVDARDRGVTGTGSGEEDLERDFCLVNPGNAFYVDLPNGRYRLTFIVGDSTAKSGITVRADGIPILPSIGAAAHRWSKVSVLYESGKEAFSSTRVGPDGKPFPMQKSGRIRFEFIASIALINALMIEPVSDAEWYAKPVLYTASDSTVSTYNALTYPPFPTGLTFMGWGEALHFHFDKGIIIDNQAQPGRSSRSFAEEGILDAILNRIKPGDYLFIMFAINDSADTVPSANNPTPYNNRKTSAGTTHKAWTRLYINEARKRGGIPVLVTGQIKCTYDTFGRFYNSVQGYPQADRELAWELGAPLVDLNKESIDYLTALGPLPDDGDASTERLPVATQWYRTNPDGSVNDYIHLCPFGANEYARRVSRLVLKTPGLENLSTHVIAPSMPQPAFSVRSSY